MDPLSSKASTASERKPYKDWFDKAAAVALATQIDTVHKGFDNKAFVRASVRNLESLEFNDRVKQFAAAMREHLPPAYPKAIKILVKSLPTMAAEAKSVTDGWLQWPVGQFIADYGTDHLYESLDAMVEVTQRFSSEFAVRPFVALYPDEVFEYLTKLTDHKSEHVRRWCSEGTRTRLPWGVKLHQLIKDPAPVWVILDQLIDDDSEYVRKSVANNINDLSKDHPQQVLKHCRQWKKKSKPRRDWIIKHGLRTLIKQGNTAALELTGFAPPSKLHVSLKVLDKKIQLGGSVGMQAIIENKSDKSQSLMVDYIVHYVRKNNVTNEKVFKWKSVELGSGDKLTLDKKHPMKETTVRALYKGRHKLEIQINGQRCADAHFMFV